MELVSGCIKAILEKYTEPIVSKMADFTKSEWEKFKIDSDIAFLKYLENAYSKYSKVKTILYKTEPKFIYNFFEFPNLRKGHMLKIDSSDINNLLNISNFLIIQGTGGIGKSTFFKHLFINEIEKNDLIPIFVELKDLNDIETDYTVSNIVLSKLHNLGCNIESKYLDHAFKSGCFLFLLDGYDEIISLKKNIFFKKITEFCDKYPDNYFILSSRPYGDFIEFQRFTVLNLLTFSKEQTLSLISKIDYDMEIKSQFYKAVDEVLYDKHKSFASNPLLLNIMLLTFDNYAEIPEKLHLFYSNAFDTLYFKHDATKGGYKRELKSKLSFDSFKRIFSNFCFMTYYHGKVEFTYDELVMFLKKSKIIHIEFDIEAYIDDLINSICVIFKEGMTYSFTHRSFQEYFTAVFLKELSDDNFSKMSAELINKDPHRAANDNVFGMLYDMCSERVEQNVLIPLLEKIEEECSINKYDFYYKLFKPKFVFDCFDDSLEIQLGLRLDSENEKLEFVKKFSYKYTDKNKLLDGDDKLLKFIEKNMNYEFGNEIDGMKYIENQEFYMIFKNTWIGKSIETIANLRTILTEKKKENELNLCEFLL